MKEIKKRNLVEKCRSDYPDNLVEKKNYTSIRNFQIKILLGCVSEWWTTVVTYYSQRDHLLFIYRNLAAIPFWNLLNSFPNSSVSLHPIIDPCGNTNAWVFFPIWDSFEGLFHLNYPSVASVQTFHRYLLTALLHPLPTLSFISFLQMLIIRHC